MLSILFSQAYFKIVVMLNFGDNSISEPTQENYFPGDFIYDEKDGWRIAFGITAYDDKDSEPFDESFGTINAYLKVWGEKDAQGNIKPLYFRKLETQPCSQSEINLHNDPDQDKYKFFFPASEYENDINRFFNVLQCLKNDDAELMGDYNSATGRQLVITFEICRDKPGICKDEAKIMNWLRRKFLLVLENEEHFDKEVVN